jgi:hypothetical protein
MRALALLLSGSVVLGVACSGADPADGDGTKADADAAGGDQGVAGDQGVTGDNGTTTGSDATGGDTAQTDAEKPLDSTGNDAEQDAIIPFDIAPPTCDPKAPPADQWWNCQPKKGTAGALHGKKCEKDEDCLYGRCMFGLPQAGYDKAIGICSKNCGYPGGGDAAYCKADNGGGGDFDCALEKTANSGNDKRDKAQVPYQRVYKACTRTCKSDADCMAWNPELPTCIKSSTKYVAVGTLGACIRAIANSITKADEGS